MNIYSLSFQEIDKSMLDLAGGKGANLAELSKIQGIRVPQGFCITTEAYKRIIGGNSELERLLNELVTYDIDDGKNISQTSARIRHLIETTPIPIEINEEIFHRLGKFEETTAYAIRSSATAEDLPMASFAGQYDSYLNIIGKDAVLTHISKCWASLFTGRAIIYRIQNGFDHRKVFLSVVVQEMIFPQASGVLFTADPLTSNRKVSSIDAGFGLGEAMVAGLVNADNYKVANGVVIEKKILTKRLEIFPLTEGGTSEQAIEVNRQRSQTLTDEQISALERIGRKIEARFGSPQDIEWCLSTGDFYIVQSRSITRLFPIPETNDDGRHIYISVGHQQMMTDAMKPLGLSIYQLTGVRSRVKAGGRLFVDVIDMLASVATRDVLLEALGKAEPLTRDALLQIIQRGDFISSLANDRRENQLDKNHPAISSLSIPAKENSNGRIVEQLIMQSQLSVATLKQSIQSKSGLALFDFILNDLEQFKKSLFAPQSFGLIKAAMDASSWVNENVEKWLGEKSVADTIAQSVPNNITSQMGLAVLDLADVIRPYPKIIEFLKNVKDDGFLKELIRFDGGKKVQDAINIFLDKYGMRCVGEIDIARTRWSEKPITILSMLLGHLKNSTNNASGRKFEHGREEALKMEQTVLARLKHLPDGIQKANDTKRMIDVIRSFSGYREYPKYEMVSRYFIYKKGLLKEAVLLAQANVIQEKEDVYYLTFEEFREVVGTYKIDANIINSRKREFKLFEILTPPRVVTSDGEIITGSYKREKMPAGSIVGLAVSSGIVEGRARVILRMEDADMDDGDILVTTFTDPSWTPLFLSIKGLVTEVGGLMTHGAVIAREYGLPAIVGVENATKLIKDGQRIRVNGTDGIVEIL